MIGLMYQHYILLNYFLNGTHKKRLRKKLFLRSHIWSIHEVFVGLVSGYF